MNLQARKTDSYKRSHVISNRKYRLANLDKYRAQTKLGNALRDGKIRKLPCKCGETKVHAHHEDYSKPLEVTWLCDKHHKRLHYPRAAAA